MNKKLLLERYPELILEISREIEIKRRNSEGNFVKTVNEYLEEQAKPIPEWEVLSFRATNGTGTIATLRDNGKYTVEHLATSDYEGYLFGHMLEKNLYEIHSVKRVSDGEIFTLGDYLEEHPKPIVAIKLDKEYKGGLKLSTDSETNYGSCIEYAKKTKAPEWEILTYVAKNNPKRITKKRRGQDLLSEFWSIHSVKRLYDGAVFTVGDRTVKGIIKSFRILDNGEFAIDYNNGCSGIGIYHEWLEKLTPLFTTEDGVDVFEGDSFAHTNGWAEPKAVVAEKRHLNYSLPMDKLFSTKEAAENYVLMNKPLLSMQDVLTVGHIVNSQAWENRLKELAKSKL